MDKKRPVRGAQAETPANFVQAALGAVEACDTAARKKKQARSSGGAGLVTLVGAGPGDPELLTVRAVRALASADVVVYDHLVSDDIMELVRPGAELIYAGKQSGCHSLSQDEISKLLVALARRGGRIVRLKGGDPFIFGRGGEEVQFLFAHGIPFEVVPGVTSASGAASYAGIPLTHRDHAQACVFVTGHSKADGPDLDWAALARPRQTLVIYMGLAQVGAISAGLIAHGLDPATPAALIERATTPEQRVVTDTLAGLAEAVRRERVSSPALIIVGSVVTLHASLGMDGRGARIGTREDAALPLS